MKVSLPASQSSILIFYKHLRDDEFLCVFIVDLLLFLSEHALVSPLSVFQIFMFALEFRQKVSNSPRAKSSCVVLGVQLLCGFDSPWFLSVSEVLNGVLILDLHLVFDDVWADPRVVR